MLVCVLVYFEVIMVTNSVGIDNRDEGVRERK